jgi:hypothetical protein
MRRKPLEMMEDLDSSGTPGSAQPGKIAGLLTQRGLRCNTANGSPSQKRHFIRGVRDLQTFQFPHPVVPGIAVMQGPARPDVLLDA